MSVIKFDYIAHPYFEDGKLDAIYRPMISIKLGANHKIFAHDIKCLLDSGADFNLLPADVGLSLGLNIKKGKKVTHIGIGDVGIAAYRHSVKIYLGGYNFNTSVDFSYDHKIPLLGRYGFFKYFKSVKFDEIDLRSILEY